MHVCVLVFPLLLLLSSKDDEDDNDGGNDGLGEKKEKRSRGFLIFLWLEKGRKEGKRSPALGPPPSPALGLIDGGPRTGTADSSAPLVRSAVRGSRLAWVPSREAASLNGIPALLQPRPPLAVFGEY